ncbi:MAG TPA: hypothetical protein VK816_08290, partial [Jatrophihabitantaceae bacterium]|nr:hypothetical protein [Jatrophihabitantaceae bacterium]
RPAVPRIRYGRYSSLGASGPGRPHGPASTPHGPASIPHGPALMTGRWSRLPLRETDPTAQALAVAELMLDRYGVVTRGSVVAEGVFGGFSTVYPVLKAAEEAGRVRRGYFVDGLGAAQFALPAAVEQLRALPREQADSPAKAIVLAATDPANPYGAALPWPAQPTRNAPAESGTRGHQPARKAGALVVVGDGECLLYVERGGRTMLSFTADEALLRLAADALALAVREGLLGRLSVEQADGAPVTTSSLGIALEAAGFRPTPRGLRLRG